MNCKSAELYMNALLDNELPVKDSLEIIAHIESCQSCKEKWELNEETRAKLKHFVSSIKASPDFRKKILSSFGNESNNKVFYLKPLLLAASIAFLIGLGLFSNSPLSKSPTLDTLHNNTNIQLVTNDIDQVSSHINIPLNSEKLSAFKEAKFNLEGAAKLKESFNRDIGLVAFKNDEGQKISLCFLPDNYNISMCHEIEMNGVVFHCGKGENCQFAYWKQDGKTIALVSNNFTAEEMIYLAVPYIKEA